MLPMTLYVELFSKRRVRTGGFTRLDLVAGVVSLLLLLAVCLPVAATRSGQRAGRIVCVNNLRQIGAAWRMSATSLNDTFPFQFPFVFSGQVRPEDAAAYQWYQTISNELATTRILVCPNDSRTVARDFGFLRPENLSYFIGADVGFDLSRTILGGDRNVTGGPTASRYMDLLPQQAPSLGWNLLIHNRNGNLLQSDGSVQQYANSGLQQAVRTSGDQRNRVILTDF